MLSEIDREKEQSKKQKRDHVQESIDRFLEQDDETWRRVRLFNYSYGPGPDEDVTWQILEEREQIMS